MMRFIFIACFFFIQFTEILAQHKQLNLLGHWRDSTVVGSSAYDNAFNEIWGFWVNDREYAAIGSTSGTHLIDVTDPKNPTHKMLIKGAVNGPSIIHRDYDDYQCYLYAVCDEGRSTLQIIDISQLPDTAIVVYDSREFMTRVHNIYIDIPKARLYTCSESTDNGFFALGLYDISDPVKPKLLGHYNRFGDITASHVHDAYVRNDTAYLNCGGEGLAVMDFSDPSNPKALLTLKPNEYPFPGYNHSGWLTPNGLTYVMADETHGSPLKVFDLNDFSNAKAVSTLYATKDSTKAIPHNPLVSCDYAYVAYYYDGLIVYDIKDPKKPVIEATYPTSVLPNLRSYKGAWGVYPYLPSGNILVSDMQNGLFVLEAIEKPCNAIYSCQDITNTSQADEVNSQVFPNPAIDKIQLLLEDSFEQGIYQILDLTGKVHLKGNLKFSGSSHSINIDKLVPGIYILKTTMDGLSKSIRLVKAP